MHWTYISSCLTPDLLTLNSSKAEFLFVENKQQLTKVDNTSLKITHSVHNLDFISDERLTLSDKIFAVCTVQILLVRYLSTLFHLSVSWFQNITVLTSLLITATRDANKWVTDYTLSR